MPGSLDGLGFVELFFFGDELFELVEFFFVGGFSLVRVYLKIIAENIPLKIGPALAEFF